MSDQAENAEPQVIYLQYHGDGDPDGPGSVRDRDATWCRDRIFESDIKYIRAKQVATKVQIDHREWREWRTEALEKLNELLKPHRVAIKATNDPADWIELTATS